MWSLQSTAESEAAPSEKGPNFVMLSPSVGLLPAGHSFQRGDWLLVTFPPTGTPGISVTKRGDVSVEAEVTNITPPPGQGILVRMVGELGHNAGEHRASQWVKTPLRQVNTQKTFQEKKQHRRGHDRI